MGDRPVKKSTFRAVNNSNEQNVFANTPIFPVFYPDEIFDLNNEYDSDTSSFIPKKDGVYLIIASIAFFPNDITASYRLVLNIRVNEEPVVTDNEFFGPNPVATGDEVSVSAILDLEEKDQVGVSPR